MFKQLALILIINILLGSLVTQASSFSEDIFPWLTQNSLTKYVNESDFRPRDPITRGEASKFVVNFAGLIGIDKTDASCSFSDTKNYDVSLRPFTVEACEYGLFRGSNGKFLPSNNITEAQALAVVIRSAYGLQDESGKPWYSEYFSIAQELGIISNETLSSLDKTPITREKLANWLYQVERANADASASSRDGDTALYEIEADGPSDCSSFETYDTTRKVCAFECKTELECKMTQEKIDAELAGWTDSLEGTNRDTPTGETESTPANTKVLYSVNTGEALTFKNGTDTVEYRNLWKELAGLSPDTISDRFIENFEVYADSGSDIIAFVSDDDRNGKWKMSINLPTHKLTDIKGQKATLIHELSHIITLNTTQFMTPTGSCPNYETEEGCTTKNSYLNNFVKKFWGTAKTATYDENRFVSEYATSSPEEDIAESFAFYVLGSNFSDTNIREQKMNFWNSYPDIIKIRTEMRDSLTSEIIRARKAR